jgi:hypothetical protein
MLPANHWTSIGRRLVRVAKETVPDWNEVWTASWWVCTCTSVVHTSMYWSVQSVAGKLREDILVILDCDKWSWVCWMSIWWFTSKQMLPAYLEQYMLFNQYIPVCTWYVLGTYHIGGQTRQTCDKLGKLFLTPKSDFTWLNQECAALNQNIKIGSVTRGFCKTFRNCWDLWVCIWCKKVYTRLILVCTGLWPALSAPAREIGRHPAGRQSWLAVFQLSVTAQTRRVVDSFLFLSIPDGPGSCVASPHSSDTVLWQP